MKIAPTGPRLEGSRSRDPKDGNPSRHEPRSWPPSDRLGRRLDDASVPLSVMPASVNYACASLILAIFSSLFFIPSSLLLFLLQAFTSIAIKKCRRPRPKPLIKLKLIDFPKTFLGTTKKSKNFAQQVVNSLRTTVTSLLKR